MKIGYARVSTEKTEQDQSVDAQIDALRRAGCQKILQERRSAFKGKRKQWEAAKDLIQSGKVSHFMVCSLSRSSRQGENKEMSRLCKSHGVEFVILDGTASDVTTPEGLLMVQIFDAVNEADSLIKGMAVKRGMNARRASGATATGKCPFGYVYDGAKPVPGPDWQRAKDLWASLRDEEFLVVKVLRQQPDLPFSDAGLRKWIGNPLLMGRPRYADIECEPLVDSAEWHQAQEIISKRCKFGARAPRRIHLFTQSVVCGNCGKWMTTCWSGKQPKNRLKCLNTRCTYYGKGLAEWKVRDQLIKELRDAVPVMLSMVEEVTQIKSGKPTPEQLTLQSRLDSLLSLKRMGTPEMDKAISATRANLEALAVRQGPDWTGWADLIRQDAFLEGMTCGELRAVISELVEEIRYVGNSIEVEITLRNPA